MESRRIGSLASDRTHSDPLSTIWETNGRPCRCRTGYGSCHSLSSCSLEIYMESDVSSFGSTPTYNGSGRLLPESAYGSTGTFTPDSSMWPVANRFPSSASFQSQGYGSYMDKNPEYFRQVRQRKTPKQGVQKNSTNLPDINAHKRYVHVPKNSAQQAQMESCYKNAYQVGRPKNTQISMSACQERAIRSVVNASKNSELSSRKEEQNHKIRQIASVYGSCTKTSGVKAHPSHPKQAHSKKEVNKKFVSEKLPPVQPNNLQPKIVQSKNKTNKEPAENAAKTNGTIKAKQDVVQNKNKINKEFEPTEHAAKKTTGTIKVKQDVVQNKNKIKKEPTEHPTKKTTGTIKAKPDVVQNKNKIKKDPTEPPTKKNTGTIRVKPDILKSRAMAPPFNTYVDEEASARFIRHYYG